MICPNCGNTRDITTERRPDGDSECGKCGHKGKTSTFQKREQSNPMSEWKKVFLDTIQEWKYFWMNQKQNSEQDFQNYQRRAMAVDANMQDHLASCLEKVVAPLEAKLAEAQRIKVEYDRWLSNGVYYTYEEYERDIRPLLNQQAQLSEAQAEIERLRGALEKVFHTASPSASRNEWVCFKAADEALAKYAEGKDDGGRDGRKSCL